ncbi:MAG: DUF4982 domain-containing protein [Acidobacteriales bacterium]|nr:DUF4982 domain-containing protein [Terriglobales bacterium]
MNPVIRSLILPFMVVAAGAHLCAQTLADIGTTVPTPGTYDISQLSISGNQTAPDGLNYYTDNQSDHNAGEPGQTFTPGANPAGYLVTSVALRTGGLGSATYSGISTPQPYYLHIYSVSGSTATLLQTYTSGNITFSDGDWLKWSGLSVPLSANTTYAYSFGKASTTSGWEPMAVASGNPKSGGEIALISPTSGAITFGSSHGFDAAFDLGLDLITTPTLGAVSVLPANSVFSGTMVTISASVAGALPLYYQWQFNGGTGYTNLTGANTNSLAFTAAVTNTGSYQLVVTNSYGAVTSAPIALTVTLDTNPPVVLRAFNVGATNVEVDFSKPLETASAANAANYSFLNSQPVTSVLFAPNGTSVLLGTTPLVYGSNYTVVVNGVRDQAVPPNTVAPNSTASFTSKLQTGDLTGAGSETNLMTLRANPVTTHAGENVSFVLTNYNDSAWRQLNLPHDWFVELGFSSGGDGNHGYKASSGSSIAWYRHTFILPSASAGKVFRLDLDGVFRNALIWFNGHCVGRDVSGYAPISFDVTPYVNPGGTNVLVVRVDASRTEGWFYEGAGIYRHVWLVESDPVHVAHWGTYVATTSLAGSNATIVVQTDVTNQSALTAVGSLTSTLCGANNVAVTNLTVPINIAAGAHVVVTQTVTMAANLWSLQTPYLYNLVSTVSNQNTVADLCNKSFGVRMVSWDGVNGVFINGQHVEIQGMCNHQDHAGVGSAMPDRLQYYRIERLKQMGVNACRTSHNAPTPEFLDVCDRLGMLVLDETRRVGSDPESLGELERMIRRDRNRACVFCWSLANEEWSVQGTTNGAAVMTVMQNLAHSLDSTRKCTAALNGAYGPDGFVAVLDVAGINYNSYTVTPSFHSTHPYIIGTEQGSTTGTRGMYFDDTNNCWLASYDLISTSPTTAPNLGWTSTAESWWSLFAGYPWTSGGFVWTGFDYRGEETPYGWPAISSQFGVMDVCGFAKDNFYYYQANWSLKPVLHILPHWNWAGKEGQPITVWAYGNCQSAELFLNGVSQGRQTVNAQSHLAWSVPYAAGTLQAVGYINGVPGITNTVVTTGVPVAITLTPDRSTIFADGVDISIITVAAVDSQGRVVPTATNLVNFSISGGTIIGVGNGNPSSHELDKASQRSVFNGLAQLIVQSDSQSGPITLTATASGLTSAPLTITKATTLPPPAAPTSVAAVAGNARVTVSWDIVPGATTYNLLRATSPGGPYAPIAPNIGGVNLGYVDMNITNLTTYYYVVTANGAWNNGNSASSAEVSATPAPLVTGLAAKAVISQVLLTWNSVSGASYNVKRSPTSGGPYAVIASMVSGTNFTDASAVGCQSYYYVVTMTNGGFESLPSNEASVSSILPPQLSSVDIGTVGAQGNAAYCSGQFTIVGSGGDIWGNSDAFQFVYAYVPVTTNCDIRARVASVQNTSGNAKAALMIRESLVADSRHVMADVEPSAGIEFIWRNATGGSSSVSSVAGTAPNWIRLTRTNNTFTAYRSADGNVWTQISSSTNISMATAAYVGLAVCSHNAGVLNTSVMDNLTATFGRASGAPILNPVGNQTVNVGQPVSLSVSGQDTNSPPFALAFSLLNAPTGASLNQTASNNAAFYWRPGVPDGSSTNQITLKVANNAWPSLSATQSFSVFVNPLAAPGISSVSVAGGQFSFSASGQSGPDYAIETSTNLTQWSNVFITNSPALPFNWTDATTNSAQRFYRIKLGPPPP